MLTPALTPEAADRFAVGFASSSASCGSCSPPGAATRVLLVIAGHETTVSLIGNVVLALLSHPDELAKLRADPSLVPSAVEELLRYDGPVERALNRWAAEGAELGGRTIRRGDRVIVILGSADRDPARFPDPDDELRWRPVPLFRSLVSLPVAWG